MKLIALLFLVCSALAQVVPPLAPISIRRDIPVGYFGPPPSSAIDPAFIGPVLLLNSTISIDVVHGTVTLPLYHGANTNTSAASSEFWFIITDSSDLETAQTLGVHFSPKLAFVSPAAMRIAQGNISEGVSGITFGSGTVDFTLDRDIIPGVAPNYWPLNNQSSPGSKGDAEYSPLVLLPNRIVLDAPMVASDISETELNAFCSGVPNTAAAHAHIHDRVVAICPSQGFVTLNLSLALSFSRPFWYLAMDSSNKDFAAIEKATWAPKLSLVTTDCFRSSTCPTQIAMAVVNGPTDLNFTSPIAHNETSEFNVSLTRVNPFRQGLNSAALGEGDVLWVVGEIPSLGLNTSPLWDVFEIEWTPDAVMLHLVTRLRDIFEAFALNVEEWMSSIDGGAFKSSNIIMNSPSVWRFY